MTGVRPRRDPSEICREDVEDAPGRDPIVAAHVHPVERGPPVVVEAAAGLVVEDAHGRHPRLVGGVVEEAVHLGEGSRSWALAVAKRSRIRRPIAASSGPSRFRTFTSSASDRSASSAATTPSAVISLSWSTIPGAYERPPIAPSRWWGAGVRRAGGRGGDANDGPGDADEVLVVDLVEGVELIAQHTTW